MKNSKKSLIRSIKRTFPEREVVIDEFGINPNTKEGSFKLLILAVLYAARVKEDVAEKTFKILDKEGFTNIKRLSKRDKKDEGRVLEILNEYYHCQTSKKGKRDAIFDNASKVKNCLNGDIRELFKRDSNQTIGYISKNLHIKAKAHYFCREMKMNGPWKEFDPSLCPVPDVHVKRALVRSGLAKGFPEDMSDDDAVKLVHKYFGVSDMPIFLLGKEYCSKWKCSKCPVKDYCLGDKNG